jgi:hypothetical protein
MTAKLLPLVDIGEMNLDHLVRVSPQGIKNSYGGVGIGGWVDD